MLLCSLPHVLLLSHPLNHASLQLLHMSLFLVYVLIP
jgi:hypothetical protein